MMRYPAVLEPTLTGLFVGCPDIPEVLAEGHTVDEAPQAVLL